MTKYLALINRSISELVDQSDEARSSFYKKAHLALHRQLQIDTSLTQSDADRERLELILAISRVEQRFTYRNPFPSDRAVNKGPPEGGDQSIDYVLDSPRLTPESTPDDSRPVIASSDDTGANIGSSTALLAANLSEAILPFIRNIALARLMPPSQFGLAISLSVVLGMVEVMTDFGLPIFAVRRDTPAPATATMHTLQSLTLIRSTVLAIIFVAISPWVAAAFGAPHSVWIYALLGPIAIIRGFENLGTKEVMRDFIFWPEAVCLATTQVVWVVVTISLASLTHTFECMIWGMLAGTVATLIMTNILSPRRFGLGWNHIARNDATKFGRPLILNGLAVALSLSDRLLVGSLLGPVVLAMYNVAYGTASLPRTVLSKFLISAFLPLFVKNRRLNGNYGLYDSWAWCLSCVGFCYGLCLSIIGDQVIGLVFTGEYQPSRLFMTIAGISVCVKFLMLLPVPGAYASGNTKLVTLGSLFSASIIIPGAGILFFRRDVNAFLTITTATEFSALLLFTRLALYRQPFTKHAVWTLIVGPVAALACLSCLSLILPNISVLFWSFVGIIFLIGAIILYTMAIKCFSLTVKDIIGGMRRTRPLPL